MDLIPDFIKRRHSEVEIRYEHPLLQQISEETYGILIYQEQVQQAANLLAGYSLGDADLLRRAMGKKDPDEMTNLFNDAVSKKVVTTMTAQLRRYCKLQKDPYADLPEIKSSMDKVLAK